MAQIKIYGLKSALEGRKSEIFAEISAAIHAALVE